MKQDFMTCPDRLEPQNLSYFNVLIHRHLGARDRQKVLLGGRCFEALELVKCVNNTLKMPLF